MGEITPEGKTTGLERNDPRPEASSNAVQRIAAGLRQQEQEYKKIIGEKVTEAGNLAWQAGKKVRPSKNYLNFDTYTKANGQLRELKAKLDVIKQYIGEGLQNVTEDNLFKADVNEALTDIDKIFRGE